MAAQPLGIQGLEAINAALRDLYSDQQNPLQMTTKVKYWLGGPDPLDYVSMFAHPGDPATDTPPHWHYVSFGLTDLHGDNRVHKVGSPGAPSGFGFELTFRLLRNPCEDSPPLWPVDLMQTLTKYVFQSGNCLCAGDHVSWHVPLDKKQGGLMEHMLLAEDPRLAPLDTPLGTVNFVQIVGATAEELKAAQQWNGPGLLNLLRQHAQTGGPFLVTSMRREESLFEVDVSARERVREGVAREGSNLTGVTGLCGWDDPEDFAHMWLKDIKQSPASSDLNSAPLSSTQRPDFPLLEGEVASLLRERLFEEMHVQLNMESGSLLPLALRGRLLHGRHFTFKQLAGDVAITLVSEGVDGSHAGKEQPFVAKGFWLHVYLDPAAIPAIIKDLEVLEKDEKPSLPLVFQWPQIKLKITILQE